MKKVAVVYYSSTGNTKMMAEAIKDAVEQNGNQADLFYVSDTNANDLLNYDAYAFGCSAMGAEQLEDGEFEPLWNEVSPNLGSKPVALFGSYGWGTGQWMQDWQDDASSKGVNLIQEGLILCETPDENGLNLCKELGKKL